MNDCTIVTVACANVATMARTFEMVHAQKATDKWFVLDNCYSLESSMWLQENKDFFNYRLFYTPDGLNIGLHNGFNLMLPEVKTSHICIVDPDMFICSRHFDAALLKHSEDPRNVWVAAFNTYSLTEMRNPTFEKSKAGWIIIPDHPVIIGLSLISTAWVREVGGLQEPTALYGGLESFMWRYLDQKTKRWVFVLNAVEGWKDLMPGLEDEWYIEWKIQHAHHGDNRSIDQFRKEYKKK
jgi:GT2 family glycosyltransferase